MTVAQVHSVPLTAPESPCVTTGGRAHPRLRPLVLGYGGFRSGSGRALAHRLLPVPFVTLILDRDVVLVTGARGVAAVDGLTTWGCGVTVGLTPYGVAALLGVPMGALAGLSLLLGDVVGRRAAELGERLAGVGGVGDRGGQADGVREAAGSSERPTGLSDAVDRGRLPTGELGRLPTGDLGGWPTGLRDADPGEQATVLPDAGNLGERATGVRGQFALLDDLLPGLAARPAPPPDPVVAAAWELLQRPSPVRVGAVASALGVSRRRLERSFVRQVGLTPAAVSRIARFQRAVGALSRGTTLADAAAVGGYADQPHLTRDMRALTGITPGALCRAAFVPEPAAFVSD
ncbi:AraC family transcriptional regulator [Actinoplanes sp. TBRC 11911]|uniref:helix-turn-helix domain-containing protein n=1 Tax=Actinoplanes sp. TBRC 11911 TaxID=2729386 RepID=UPI00145F7B98|nr:helix-turn-helix domain-containing protein [Actinoplanes sp. TBRC 11911]NMO55530.1 AraC family transcriptional regulator [Actinoplanes sp. TBRC 11911]